MVWMVPCYELNRKPGHTNRAKRITVFLLQKLPKGSSERKIVSTSFNSQCVPVNSNLKDWRMVTLITNNIVYSNLVNTLV